MATAHVSGLVALYIAANGRAHSAQEVYQIRQKIIDTGQPQCHWNDPDPDLDENPEPLAVPSLSWLSPEMARPKLTAAGFELSFTTLSRYVYTVQYMNSLSASNQWTDFLSTNGTGNAVALIDPASDATRFYRVVRTPLIPSPPTNIYEWNFASGDLTATIGNGVLEYADGTTSNLTVFGMADGTTVPDIGGETASYMAVAQMPSRESGYRVSLTASGPNGGGLYLNQYTIIQDILIPSPLDWTALFNTDPNNSNNAEFYVDSSGRLTVNPPSSPSWINFRLGGLIPADTWVRVAFVADVGGSGIRFYVDGTQVNGGALYPWPPDYLFSIALNNARRGDLLLFNDGSPSGNGSYTHRLYVSAWAFVDRAMTPEEIAALGGPKASGIFSGTP